MLKFLRPASAAAGVRLRSFENGDQNQVSYIQSPSHNGTHLDAPSHFIKGGKTMDDIPLDRFYGTCQVIEIPADQKAVTREFLKGVSLQADKVLLKTTNCISRMEEFAEDYVYLDADGAKMPSADVKTLGESAPAAGTTDEPQTQTVAEASEPQSADPRGSATTRMPDVESQSTDPNETSASEADAQAADSDAAPEHPAGSFFEKLSGKLSQVTDRLRGMQQKTDQLKQQTAYYKRIWDQPQTRQAIRVGFYELGEIIRHVLPRKLEVFGIVGTGDPASTGQIMAIQGMLYPWHKGNIRLEPDFEEKYIEGELHLKGRIRLGTLGICGLRILLNKNVRRLIRILRKKEEA